MIFALPWSLWVGVGLAIALVLLAVIELATGGLLRVFGPVLYFDIVRSGRRGRFFLLRGLYATGLLILLLWVWAMWSSSRTGEKIESQQMAYFAEVYFYLFASAQFFAVLLLTPGYVAGCIADDKERRTLEFLLATDLANREIVFGKMAARVGNLVMFLITGLPVLSIMQFFGGIDPGILLLTFAATGVTMLGLVGVSMIQSVQRRKVRDAIFLTYLVAAAYLGLTWIAWMALESARHTPGQPISDAIIEIAPWIEAFRRGDPIRTIVAVTQAVATTGRQGEAFLQILGEYASFHVPLFIIGVLYAVWKLRRIALRQAGASDGPRRKRGRRAWRRPQVSSRRPMVWKEVWIEGSLQLGMLARIAFTLIITAMMFVPLGILVVLYLFEPTSRMSWTDCQAFINGWLRSVNSTLSCFMIIGIAVRAAGSIGSERDRDTLTSLLTTPLTAGEMLVGKFWGAIASVRKLGYWLIAAWVIAIITFSVNPAAAVVQMIALIPPACAAAALGLCAAVYCNTTLRALLLTLAMLVVGLGFHWCISSMCCFMPMSLMTSYGDAQYIMYYQSGLTPPLVFGLIPFREEDFERVWNNNYGPYAIGALGHVTWLAIAGALSLTFFDRFAEQTNRTNRVRRMHPPPEVPFVLPVDDRSEPEA